MIYQDHLRRTISQSPAPLNIQTKVTFDERGQVVRDEDGLANYTTPGYDNNGNQNTWLDRRQKLWQFTYDKEDRLKNTTSPLIRTTQQGWNARGLLETITEPSGQLTTLGYDGRRRLTSRVDPVGTVNYGLDNGGQLLTVTQGAAVLTRTYHPSGEVATYKNANNETITYDYDRNGNLTSLTYPAIGSIPAATVTYTYDSRDRLKTMTDWAGRVTTYSWDAEGKLTGIARPNGTARRLSWDWVGQLKGVEERPASGAPLAIRTFGYDTTGRVTKRLVYPQATGWSETALNAGVDDDNRLTGGILSYDADGNTQASLLPNGPWGSTGVSNNVTGTFTWNARNQLTGVTRSMGGAPTYTYDAEGNLTARSAYTAGIARWIVDPDGGAMPRVLATATGPGLGTRYVYGVGLAYEVRADGSVRYYHYNQVGSTIALTNESGTVTGRADYSPYGMLQSASGELANANSTPFLWVGAYGVMTDRVTGLHHMRARWYSSYLRRFLSEDPIGFAGGENFYAYAGGNPISAIDPFGLETLVLWGEEYLHGNKGFFEKHAKAWAEKSGIDDVIISRGQTADEWNAAIASASSVDGIVFIGHSGTLYGRKDGVDMSKLGKPNFSKGAKIHLYGCWTGVTDPGDTKNSMIRYGDHFGVTTVGTTSGVSMGKFWNTTSPGFMRKSGTLRTPAPTTSYTPKGK